MRFQANNCQLVNPSEDCSRLLKCMKNKGDQMSSIEYIFYTFRNAFALVSEKIMGPIMLGIFGILIKLIQVLIKSELQKVSE